MKRFFNILVGLLLILGMSSCGRVATPKPFGYFYIAVPDTAYLSLSEYQAPDGSRPCADFPYDFQLSRNAQVVLRTGEDEDYWINVHYPTLNADIHCSYKPVHGNLRSLTDDAMGFVYKHVSQASAIPNVSIPIPMHGSMAYSLTSKATPLRPPSSLSPTPRAISSAPRSTVTAAPTPIRWHLYTTIYNRMSSVWWKQCNGDNRRKI